MFAVCCWEIMSYGVKPFATLPNQEYLPAIERGQRLPPPDDCPIELYSVMQACWSHNDKMRPDFDQLCEQLHHIIDPPEFAGAGIRMRSGSARADFLTAAASQSRRGAGVVPSGKASPLPTRGASSYQSSGRSSPNTFAASFEAARANGLSSSVS